MLRNVVSVLGLLTWAGWAQAADWPQLVRETGCSGGVCLQIGGDDVAKAARLVAQGPFLLHWLERDAARVPEQRRTIAVAGLSGCVTVDAWSGKVLPFVDELINLIACEGLGDTSEGELLRIDFAGDGYVALVARGSLHLVRIRDGRHLWSRESEASPGKDYSDERYVGHF